MRTTPRCRRHRFQPDQVPDEDTGQDEPPGWRRRPQAGEELAKLLEAGYAQEWWQVKLNPGAMPQATDGMIFDARQEQKPAMIASETSFANGVWSVVISRPLNAPAPYKTLALGKTYTVGFSVHLCHSAKRFHHTSYEYTFALGQGPADIVAVKQ